MIGLGRLLASPQTHWKCTNVIIGGTKLVMQFNALMSQTVKT